MTLSSWAEIELRVAGSVRDHEYQAAVDLLSEFLGSVDSPDERREALAMRGTVLLKIGEFDAARGDLELAHSMARLGDYSSYTIELLLAQLARLRGDESATRALYLRALEAAVASREYSAGAALEGLIPSFERVPPTAGEQRLVDDAIRASWEVLTIDGPVAVDFVDCIKRIRVAESDR